MILWRLGDIISWDMYPPNLLSDKISVISISQQCVTEWSSLQQGRNLRWWQDELINVTLQDVIFTYGVLLKAFFPSFPSLQEDCVEMVWNEQVVGKWNDIICTQASGFVCQKNIGEAKIIAKHCKCCGKLERDSSNSTSFRHLPASSSIDLSIAFT